MKIIDSKGRIFGKVSILDLGAACVIALVIIGIFFFPGTSGSIAQITETKPIEVEVLVRGLSMRDPQLLAIEQQENQKITLIIRNQPYGQIELKKIEELPRTMGVPQPDGSVKALPDPRPEVTFIRDLIVTVAGQAQITDDGVVLGNNKLKVGSPIELEGLYYSVRGSVMNVQVLK